MGSTICTIPWPGLTCSRRRIRPNCLSLFTSRVTAPRLRPNSSAKRRDAQALFTRRLEKAHTLRRHHFEHHHRICEGNDLFRLQTLAQFPPAGAIKRTPHMALKSVSEYFYLHNFSSSPLPPDRSGLPYLVIFEFDLLYRAHEMAFMNAVGVVKSEHPAIIPIKQMRQQKC